MDNKNLKLIKHIISSGDFLQLKSLLKDIKSKELLHVIAVEYNWDDGFEIPNLIANNKYCDLGTAILLFYYADGYVFLEDKTLVNESTDIEWKNFLNQIYFNISNNKYTTRDIEYIPPITKTQVYKLKKNNPDIKDIFLIGNNGMNIDVKSILEY